MQHERVVVLPRMSTVFLTCLSFSFPGQVVAYLMAMHRSRMIRVGLSSAALISLQVVPQAVAQEVSQRGSPLKDVCPEGWPHYTCSPGVRLCVPPALESKYGLAASTKDWSLQECNDDVKFVLPKEWSNATPEEVGYLSPAWRWRGYMFYIRVVTLDPSMIDSSVFARPHRWNNDDWERRHDMANAFEKLISPILDGGDGEQLYRWEVGRAAYHASEDMSLDQYGLQPPKPKPGAKDVCPATWSRYSCDFVRLCASPAVVRQYDLQKSEEFGYAHCKADTRTVPEDETGFSPHDVGFFAGSLINGPRYFKSVQLDSPDIFNSDIEEAIERLVLVPIPTSGLMDYDKGFDEGQAKFKGFLFKIGAAGKNQRK